VLAGALERRFEPGKLSWAGFAQRRAGLLHADPRAFVIQAAIVFGLLWVLNGAGQALVAIPASTLVASHTSTDERGRAFAAQFAITHACWPVSYPLVGHLAGALGPPITFSICGVFCLANGRGARSLDGGYKGAHVHATGEP
jgi:sugar phosphate permease